METIRMEIAFTDLAYAQKLARRLCELCPGMQINVHIPERMENIPDCDVLLTEENSRPSNLPQTVRFVSLTPEERLRPAPWILDKILDACEGRCGKLFTSKMKTAVQTLLFLAAHPNRKCYIWKLMRVTAVRQEADGAGIRRLRNRRFVRRPNFLTDFGNSRGYVYSPIWQKTFTDCAVYPCPRMPS